MSAAKRLDRMSRLLNELRRQSAAGNYAAMPRIFSRMVEYTQKPLPVKACSLMLEACGEAEDDVSRAAVAELCRKFTAVGDRASLERVLSGEGAESSSPRIKTTLLGRKIYGQMVAFNKQLRAAAEEEASPKLGGILQELFNAGLTPDSRTYTALITARAKSGDVRGALELLQQLLEEGISPDCVLLNTVLGSCARAGDVHTAAMVYAYMPVYGVKPDEKTYQTLFNCFTTFANVQSVQGKEPDERLVRIYEQISMRAKPLLKAARTFPGGGSGTVSGLVAAKYAADRAFLMRESADARADAREESADSPAVASTKPPSTGAARPGRKPPQQQQQYARGGTGGSRGEADSAAARAGSPGGQSATSIHEADGVDAAKKSSHSGGKRWGGVAMGQQAAT